MGRCAPAMAMRAFWPRGRSCRCLCLDWRKSCRKWCSAGMNRYFYNGAICRACCPFWRNISALRAQIMWHIAPVLYLISWPIAMPSINLWPREPEQSGLSVTRISVLVTPQRRVTSQMSQAVCCAGRMAMRLRSSMGRLMRSEIRSTAGNLPKLCVIRTVAVYQIRRPIWLGFWRIFKRKAARCLRPKLKISSCRMEPIRP